MTKVLLIFTQTRHAFADASGILLEKATGTARHLATIAEVAHKQKEGSHKQLSQGTCNCLGGTVQA